MLDTWIECVANDYATWECEIAQAKFGNYKGYQPTQKAVAAGECFYSFLHRIG